MNSIWLKIAGVAVVAVVIIVVLGRLGGDEPASSPEPDPQENQSFYDMAERDKQFMEEPAPVEEQPVEEPPVEPAPEPAPSPDGQAQAPASTRPASATIRPSEITRATTMHFKPMTEIEDIEAQRILPVATAGRSIGRLPVMHYNLMVQGCRQILQKWPDSWYAFRAKQMLEEMPERYHQTYKVTPEELDIKRFLTPRQGTQPRTVEPAR